jgi:hypothetical protein
MVKMSHQHSSRRLFKASNNSDSQMDSGLDGVFMKPGTPLFFIQYGRQAHGCFESRVLESETDLENCLKHNPPDCAVTN